MKKPSFVIIQDTREKKPWTFEATGSVRDISVAKLDTGDYSIKGLEDKVCIERKASVDELFVNLGVQWTRFKKEMERAKPYKYKYLVIEATMREVYRGSRYSRMNGKFVMRRLLELEEEYGIKVVFAGEGMHVPGFIIQLLMTIAEKEGLYATEE